MMFAIQVSDVKGNWMTLRQVGAVNEDDLLVELQKLLATRNNGSVRAVRVATKQVILELSKKTKETT